MLNISGGCGIIVYVNFYNPVLQVNIYAVDKMNILRRKIYAIE